MGKATWRATQVKYPRGDGFMAFADDLDPLKRRYPFLGEEYDKWIGCPLVRIPDPFSCHRSYADHFLSELIDSFSQMGIVPEIFRASDLYESEKSSDYLRKIMISRRKIAGILNRVTGSSKDEDSFFPFMPECPNCNSIKETRVTAWDEEENVLKSFCNRCNISWKRELSNVKGKLAWRCDWPMRWAFYFVDIEPFGHDHNTSGGSFESASAIVREIFGKEPPVPAPYAWIHFKSGGAMHSSSGRAISVSELAQTYPPEIIWWMFVRRELSSILLFDPHDTVIEEVHLLHQAIKRGDSKDISDIGALESIVPISSLIRKHSLEQLAVSAQLGQFEPEKMNEVLSRLSGEESPAVSQKEIAILKSWLTLHGKDEKIPSQAGSVLRELTDEDLEIAAKLYEAFAEIEPWNADIIHQKIYECSKQLSKKPKELFILVYKVLFGKEQGPRVGWFLESIGKETALRLFSAKQRDCS